MSTFNKEYRSILEGIVDNKDYQFIVTFELTPELNVRNQLKKTLNVLSEFYEAITTIKETENNQIVYIVESPDKWNLSIEDERNKFARAFYNSCKTVMAQHKINVPYTAIYKNKYEDLTNKLPELKGIFEDARAHSGNDVLFQSVYATFDKIRDESLLNELENCLTELKTTLEKEEGVGRANLANCECEIQKSKNELTFIVKHVPFTEIEADPKQKHHAENNLNHKLWECLWFIMMNKTNNNSKRDWLRAHLSVNKYVWKDSKIEDLVKKLPELKGIFESNTGLVDLVIQLNETDEQGVRTTQKVLDMIAKWIRQHAAIQYEADWSVERVDPRYEWESKMNPPRIIFKDIDTSVIDVNMYIDAIRSAGIRWFDRYREDIWEACNNYRPELHKFKYSTDENGPKMRNMTDKLPELRGIF